MSDENLLDNDSTSSNSVDSDTVDTFALVAFVLAGVALCVFFLLAAWASHRIQHSPDIVIEGKRHHAQQKRVCRTLGFVGALAMCLWAAASGVASSYAHRLADRETVDYQGKMRVTNVQYQTRRENTNPNSKQAPQYRFYYDALFALDWGYDWACPGSSKICNASQVVANSTLVCWRWPCTPEQLDEARADIETQTKAVFDPVANNYTPYVPEVGPSNDVDWPSIVAYGDCDTCTVWTSIPSEDETDRLGIAAVALLASALVLGATSSLLSWRYRSHFALVAAATEEEQGELEGGGPGDDDPAEAQQQTDIRTILEKRLQPTTFVVVDSDLVELEPTFCEEEDTEEEEDNDNDDETNDLTADPERSSSQRRADQFTLQLPESLLAAASSKSLSPCNRTVPCVCAICLSSYRAGDRVSWSHTCSHAFHTDCLIQSAETATALTDSSSSPHYLWVACPMCRESFVPL